MVETESSHRGKPLDPRNSRFKSPIQILYQRHGHLSLMNIWRALNASAKPTQMKRREMKKTSDIRIDALEFDPEAAFLRRGSSAKLDNFQRSPVLIILHQLHSSPGHVGNWFVANGFQLDIRLPCFGDPLPETLEGHVGAVIFGGPQSANDTDDFIRREVDWISVALKEKKPFLGICLGAQMLALNLGAEVRAHAEGYVEHGYYPITPTRQGTAVMNWPTQVYQWHREGFIAPETSDVLAEGELFCHQAFQLGPAYALQFHPEITQMAMNHLVTRSACQLVMPGARPKNTHRCGYLQHGPRQRQWLGEFLTKWVGVREGKSDPLLAAA
jgi:GMP synthase (glutamine-hydrolysing)